MPHIPFLWGFNESVSGAAVRFHLKSALQKSSSVGELRRNLDFKVKNGNFNNATKEVLAKITKEVDEGAQNIAHKQAQQQAKEQAQKEADEKFYARHKAEQARIESITAQREASEGLSDLSAHEANFSFYEDIPTKQL